MESVEELSNIAKVSEMINRTEIVNTLGNHQKLSKVANKVNNRRNRHKPYTASTTLQSRQKPVRSVEKDAELLNMLRITKTLKT